MSIKHKLINTGNYLLIVDDSEIKEGDWFLSNYSSSYYIDKKASESSQRFALNSNNVFINPKKIIAHLPLNNSPILEGVILLPSFEDEVEKLADDYGFRVPYDGTNNFYDLEAIKHYKAGYNKSKERYAYTKEDLRKQWEMFKALYDNRNGEKPGIGKPITNYPIIFESFEQYLQSLQQPKTPVEFECEVEDVKMLKNRAGGVTYFGKPKTTTNSQGLTQWVGEYIYD